MRILIYSVINNNFAQGKYFEGNILKRYISLKRLCCQAAVIVNSSVKVTQVQYQVSKASDFSLFLLLTVSGSEVFYKTDNNLGLCV